MGKNLITKNEYKAYAGINGTAQDAIIDALIPRVSELVKNYCRRTFVDYVEDARIDTFNGGYNKFYLKEYPVLSVIGIEYSTDYGQNYTDLVEYTDYIWNVEEDAIEYILSEDGFPKKINGYRVSYYAGYEAIPEDLKLAVFDLLTYYMKSDSISHTTRTPSSSTMQLEYITSATFPVHIARVLNLYRASWD